MNDLLRPLDKPFPTFSPPNLNPAMHGHMGYMGTSGLGGMGYMGQQMQHPHHQGMGGGFGGGFPLSHNPPSLGGGGSSLSGFSGIPSSGLNLSTSSNMVGAITA